MLQRRYEQEHERTRRQEQTVWTSADVAWLLCKPVPPKCLPPLHLLRSAFPKGSPASNNGAGLLSEGLVQTSFLPPFQRGTLPIGKPPEPKYPPPPHLLGRMFRADSPVLLNSPRCDGERSGMDASATGLGVQRDDAVKAGCGKDGGGGKRVAEALEDCGVGFDCDDRSDGSGGDGELVATKFRFSCGPQDAGDGLSLRGSARMPVVLKRRKLWRPHDDEWSGPTPPVVNDGRFGRDKAARTIQCDICKGFFKGNGAGAFACSPVGKQTGEKIATMDRQKAWECGRWDALWFCDACCPLPDNLGERMAKKAAYKDLYMRGRGMREGRSKLKRQPCTC